MIILVLALSFRKLEGVLFPLISLAITCIWVTGLIGVLGITFTMATLLVPILLLVVGSAYGIHIMTHFYEAVGEKEDRISYDELTVMLNVVSRRIRLSVILAGVTTAAGFLSQLFSPLNPFKVFGALCAAGIFFALLLTFILIPALIRIRYRRGLSPAKVGISYASKGEDRDRESAWIRVFNKIVYKGRIPVLLLSIVIFGATILLLPKINIGTNLIEFFSQESKMVQDTNTFNEKLKGTGNISLVIEAPGKGDILRPRFLNKLETFENWLPREAEQVTSVQSVVPGIKRMNMIMNADRVPYEIIEDEETEINFFADGGLWGDTDEPDAEPFTTITESEPYSSSANETFNEIPTEPSRYGLSSEDNLHELLTQYMILYSGSLEMMLNDPLEPDQILVTIRLDRETSRDIRMVTQAIQDYWDYSIPDGWTYKIAGVSTFNVVLMDLVANSQLISLSISLVIVFLIMLLLFRSVKAGLIGMIPVVFALMGIFSFMVVLGFNLDIITSLLAALAVGVGVDYAIHFMTAYRRELSFGNPTPLISVYRTTGRAILFNAASVSLGFLSLLGSSFIPIRQMGILFAVAMVFAAFSALVVLPIAINISTKETIPWKETTRILTGEIL
ncbi:MAG TPA: hypothetical protein DCO79_12180 [Spirochaeta sp.]|nr:hypothetical protein [Spirochaeta sp.]